MIRLPHCNRLKWTETLLLFVIFSACQKAIVQTDFFGLVLNGFIDQISNDGGRINNCRALARQLSFLPTELNIFDIHCITMYMYVLYLSFNV